MNAPSDEQLLALHRCREATRRAHRYFVIFVALIVVGMVGLGISQYVIAQKADAAAEEADARYREAVEKRQQIQDRLDEALALLRKAQGECSQ